MGISIKEIVEEMTSKGYKLTEYTIKHYLNEGLLPEPEKQGGYGEGVKLIFVNKDEVLYTLKKIYELKGRGFKLSEIKDSFLRERIGEKIEKLKNRLKTYIEIEGRCYKKLLVSPDEMVKPYKKYYFAENVGSLLNTDYGVDLSDLYKCCRELEQRQKDANKVELLGLYNVPHIYKGRLVHCINDIEGPIIDWILLRREYDIDWDTLVALYKKNKENNERYFHFPNPDGIRFSELSIRWDRERMLNEISCWIKYYIRSIREGFQSGNPIALKEEAIGLDSINWDFKYESVHVFIDDFLSDRCAFVPAPAQKPTYFLKRFE